MEEMLLFSAISNDPPFRKIEDEFFMKFDRIVMSKDGLQFYYGGKEIAHIGACVNPNGDTVTVSGLNALQKVELS
jgi:hypothetical protein